MVEAKHFNISEFCTIHWRTAFISTALSVSAPPATSTVEMKCSVTSAPRDTRGIGARGTLLLLTGFQTFFYYKFYVFILKRVVKCGFRAFGMSLLFHRITEKNQSID